MRFLRFLKLLFPPSPKYFFIILDSKERERLFSGAYKRGDITAEEWGVLHMDPREAKSRHVKMAAEVMVRLGAMGKK